MGRAYSEDLRERVVRAVIEGGLSRHQAAARFGVGISTRSSVQRFLETGCVKPRFVSQATHLERSRTVTDQRGGAPPGEDGLGTEMLY